MPKVTKAQKAAAGKVQPGKAYPADEALKLVKELVHVAVRATVPGRPALWLAEGYADHVGYARSFVPVERLVAPLLAEVRTGRGPTQLPTADELEPSDWINPA